MLIIFVPGVVWDNAHINIKAAALQIIKNDIFHQVGLFHLPKPKSRITKSDVCKVIFDR